MADFKILRGSSIIASGNATLTLQDTVDYTLESGIASDAWFFRICNNHFTGMGRTSSGGNQNLDDISVYVTISGNDVTLNRYGTSNNCRVDWEIVQYIGSAGGDNEIKVRAKGTQSLGTAISATTSISGATDVNDVVPFITGQACNNTGRSRYHYGLHKADRTASPDQVTWTRGHNSSTAIVSYAFVEFTGSNWTVTKESFTTPGSGDNTVTLSTSITDIAETFLHSTYRYNKGDSTSGLDDCSNRVRLTSTTQISVRSTTGTDLSLKEHIVYLIQNPDMVVTRYTGTMAGSGEEEVFNVTITAPTVGTDEVITTLSNDSTGGGTAFPRGYINHELTSSTNVLMRQSDNGQTSQYCLEIIELPTASSSTTPVSITRQLNIEWKTELSLSRQENVEWFADLTGFNRQANIGWKSNLSEFTRELNLDFAVDLSQITRQFNLDYKVDINYTRVIPFEWMGVTQLNLTRDIPISWSSNFVTNRQNNLEWNAEYGAQRINNIAWILSTTFQRDVTLEWFANLVVINRELNIGWFSNLGLSRSINSGWSASLQATRQYPYSWKVVTQVERSIPWANRLDFGAARQIPQEWMGTFSSARQIPFGWTLGVGVTREIPQSWVGGIGYSRDIPLQYLLDLGLQRQINIGWQGTSITPIDLSRVVPFEWSLDLQLSRYFNVETSIELSLLRQPVFDSSTSLVFSDQIPIGYTGDLSLTRQKNVGWTADLSVQQEIPIGWQGTLIVPVFLTRIVPIEWLVELEKSNVIGLSNSLDYNSTRQIPTSWSNKVLSGRDSNIDWTSNLIFSRDIIIQWQGAVLIPVDLTRTIPFDWTLEFSKANVVPVSWRTELDLLREIPLESIGQVQYSRTIPLSLLSGVELLRILPLSWLTEIEGQQVYNVVYDGAEIQLQVLQGVWRLCPRLIIWAANEDRKLSWDLTEISRRRC